MTSKVGILVVILGLACLDTAGAGDDPWVVYEGKEGQEGSLFVSLSAAVFVLSSSCRPPVDRYSRGLGHRPDRTRGRAAESAGFPG